jgi:LPPG:FO 2-phospho-L-lactate transferase
MIVAFAGGVGGAKLADGLYRALPPGRLAVVVNTADDFVLHGLSISPDLDTVLYTLAGIANPITGWGIDGDTFGALAMLGTLGAPDWFRLGDRDLALHVARSDRLHQGRRLTEVTASFTSALGVHAQILPMSDDPVATIVETAAGPLGFQEYFVQRACRDTVAGIRFAGIDSAALSPEVDRVLAAAEAIVFCPSNPFVSIGPILALPGLRARLRQLGVPVVAVSPIIAGQALKGPAAAMLAALGLESSVVSIARLYADLSPWLLIDERDAALAGAVREAGATPVVTPIVMGNPDGRVRLAQRVLEVATTARRSVHAG